jgi:hypothetical protein
MFQNVLKRQNIAIPTLFYIWLFKNIVKSMLISVPKCSRQEALLSV